MKITFFLMLAGLLAATSCNKKSQDERATSAPEAASAAAPIPQASVAEVADEDSDIDLPEDFADDAAKAVTAENLDMQLSAIEKEVTAGN